jgi:hypothetical protein
LPLPLPLFFCLSFPKGICFCLCFPVVIPEGLRLRLAVAFLFVIPEGNLLSPLPYGLAGLSSACRDRRIKNKFKKK